MLFLILLILQSIFRGTGPGAKACIRVLCDILVGFLGSLSTTAFDGLLDVVSGILL